MATYTITDTGNTVTNGTNLNTQLSSCVAGDTIILVAGVTYDGTFILGNKSASVSTPITIKSSAILPERRIGPGDTALMPRVRTLGGGSYGAVFQLSASAGWWIIDGVEMVDNGPSGTLISYMIDAATSSVHDITIKRCYIHNKETGTNYYRYIRFGIGFEGSGLTVQWNYISFLGYYPLEFSFGTYAPLDSMAILSIGGNTMTIFDNYLSTWYVGMFTGGSDSGPLNTGTITSSSTTSGTFSNVTGLSAGIIVRFDLAGTATSSLSGSTMTLTRTGGVVLDSSDIGRSIQVTSVGTGETGILHITAVSGATITATGWAQAWSTIPNGNCTFLVYETAIVNSVAGSVVSYTPYGIDALNHAPTAASWNYGDQGLVYDLTVRRNTFYIEPIFAADVKTNNGNHPKGYFEFKNIKRGTLDGNYFLGYPATWAYTATNQNGTAPWITTSDITITNNWFAPTSSDSTRRPALIFSDNSYINTITPSANVTISNNLIRECENLASIAGIDSLSIRHNTVINENTGDGYNCVVSANVVNTNFTFSDNIVSYIAYGMQCFIDPFTLGTCWPSGTFSKNVVVDDYAQSFSSSAWGAGGILTPIPTSFTSVGFTDYAGGNYLLAGGSTYKGLATGSTDPGVDWGALLLALGVATTPTGSFGFKAVMA